MRTNRILARLREGGATLIASPSSYDSPKIAELLGLLDFDGAWIDMEHMDYGYEHVFNMALACRATGMEPMVRIRRGEYWSYSRALEAGATGLMVPHCRSGADAAEIVRWTRFHPLGMRGMDGVEPLARYGLTPMASYMEEANRETFLVVQIEDREAVEDIDAIAATPGVDILFIGPADLSQSYGIPLQMQHELMLEATRKVAEAAARHGKWWGLPVGSAEIGARYYEQGARFFACGAAVILLQRGFRQIREEFAQLLGR
jgi:2-keto-3-deoxy-L-rhamnonate aldolase RhmA